ncbi:MAG: hypothetical protein ACE5L6_02250 [Candidatus Bathyarchaeia archaeon]
MVKIRPGTALILAHAPPWTEPRRTFLGYIIKTYTYSNTPAQQSVRQRFAAAARGTRGMTGKAMYKGRSMPRPAVEIARQLGGRGAVTTPRREEYY